ncbi:phosphatase PAP2 family protein [Nocardia fluminea]|uniref:Undecaprenyl-diphosphatase n=1 Tax=Nocardia fluminea TaxID=134984 RepID=A0A2N3WWJ2_9NOCA|nr:phosphatase PAP2 family protein [Nocardia fluminea]PKV98224.1 undecaprenyl-diphosphatase [Nocardia fluminea]
MIRAGSATAVRAAAIGAGAALTAVIPLTFSANGGPSELDAAVPADTVSPGLAQVLVAPSNAPVVVALLLVACAFFALRRQWWQAVTMLVVPEIALAVNTWLLKPLWDRQLDDHLAYPSGHTVHLVAVATTFACLVTDLRARIAIATLTVLALIAITPAMAELGYHRPTDVLGGAAAAASMAIGLCWLSEALHARHGP